VMVSGDGMGVLSLVSGVLDAMLRPRPHGVIAISPWSKHAECRPGLSRKTRGGHE
jgi:hypothetical protein